MELSNLHTSSLMPRLIDLVNGQKFWAPINNEYLHNLR